MAISNFIPTIWSENLITSLDKKYVGVANCNRDYEGEIKNKGAIVKICGVGKINVNDYTKDSDMSSPQALSDTVQELCIDQAKFFNFQIDDVDRAQCSPKLMDLAMSGAAESISEEADKYVYSLYGSAANSIRHTDISDGGLINTILKARKTLYQNNVSDSTEVVLEVSPAVAAAIMQEKIATTHNSDLYENGCIGSIAGCKIYVSNNIASTSTSTTVTYKCFMRSKRAIAFAEQLSEINAYRPEKRFADAVKGLHLYGAKVVYPNELVVIEATEKL